MDEHAPRELIRQVTTGALSRRRFVQTMIGLGLTAPMAAHYAPPPKSRGARGCAS